MSSADVPAGGRPAMNCSARSRARWAPPRCTDCSERMDRRARLASCRHAVGVRLTMSATASNGSRTRCGGRRRCAPAGSTGRARPRASGPDLVEGHPVSRIRGQVRLGRLARCWQRAGDCLATDVGRPKAVEPEPADDDGQPTADVVDLVERHVGQGGRTPPARCPPRRRDRGASGSRGPRGTDGARRLVRRPIGLEGSWRRCRGPWGSLQR